MIRDWIARRGVLAGVAASGAATLIGPVWGASQDPNAPYICPPCGCAMDGKDFAKPGTCPACGMRLVPKNPVFEPGRLSEGANLFQTRGGRGRAASRITVHYYRPRTFTPHSPILLVLPGAGRDGDEYRDAWIDTAEAAGVLVAGLTYPEADYDFAAYHLGGTVTDLVLRNMPLGPDRSPPSRIHLDDDDIVLTVNPDRGAWLFADFDRIFGLITTATGSQRTGYDVFGHSAGGQILHRAALFHPNMKAERIVAANAGLYTYPDRALPMPFGLKGTGITDADLAKSFAAPLTVLIGAHDDARETRGTLLHTPLADRYGTHRLARGRAFFEQGRERARAMGTAFHWRLQIVPDVGHDFRLMSQAAADLLYR